MTTRRFRFIAVAVTALALAVPATAPAAIKAPHYTATSPSDLEQQVLASRGKGAPEPVAEPAAPAGQVRDFDLGWGAVAAAAAGALLLAGLAAVRMARHVRAT